MGRLPAQPDVVELLTLIERTEFDVRTAVARLRPDVAPGIKRVRSDLLACRNRLVRLMARHNRTPSNVGPCISVAGGRASHLRFPDPPMLTDDQLADYQLLLRKGFRSAEALKMVLAGQPADRP